MLRRFGSLFSRPGLWRLDRRSVAIGAASGVFFGFLIPIAQIPLAASAAWFLRGNLPVAVVSTLVSNPFTYVPIYWLAHELGSILLWGGEAAPDAGWSVSGVGFPLIIGLATFAVAGSVLIFGAVHIAWRFALWIKLFRRQRRNGLSGPPQDGIK